MRGRCAGCPNRTQPIVPGRGTPGGIAIVGQAPGVVEARRGRIFTGLSGQLLEETVRQADFEAVYYTNAVACACPDDAPSTEQINACRPALYQELRDANADSVLMMGNAAVQAFFPGSKGITQLRPNRLFHDELDLWCVPTLNAAAALNDVDVFRDIAVDVSIASELKSWKPKWTVESPPPYTLVQSGRDFTRMLRDLDRSGILACDIETTGFNPVENTILSIGIGDEHHTWIIDVENDLMENSFVRNNLKMLLEDPALFWVAQNGHQFDWKWFWSKWRIDWRISFDPMLAHYALDERQGGHGLKALCKQYLGYPDYAVDIKGRFENYGDIPRLELWQYQAWDVRGTVELVRPLRQEMLSEDPDLLTLHDRILLPGTKALAIVELNGINIDEPYFVELGKQLDREIIEIRDELQQLTDELGVTNLQKAIDEEIKAREALDWAKQEYDARRIPYRTKTIESETEDGIFETQIGFLAYRSAWIKARDNVPANHFNPSSSPQVKALITKKLRLTTDTTREGLEAVAHFHPAPKLISDYRQKIKLKGTYVDGLLERRWKSDGKVHGNFLAIGTRTGRLSGQDPNWQNVPILIGPVVRNGVVATPGWKFAEIDNSQVELRIAGVFSKDERLIGVYREGRDIHREVAVTMYGKPAGQITDRERYNAKYVDFPILFGATAQSLVGTGDPPWDYATAAGFVEGFLGGFPDLAAWLEHQRRFVKKNGYVKTLFGRRRRFPLILDQNAGDVERQAINSPIQGSASDLCFTALTRVVLELHERRKRGEPEECRVLLTVHDSIGIEAVADKIEYYTTWIKIEMEKIPDEWKPLGLPFKSEIKLGTTWGNCKPFDPSPELIELAKGDYRETLAHLETAGRTETAGVGVLIS